MKSLFLNSCAAAMVSAGLFGCVTDSTTTTVTPETAARPEILHRIVNAMKRYHAGPVFPGTFSPFETVRNSKPAGVKGVFINGVTLSATMSPGIKLAI